MQDLELKNEDELQSYFIKRIAQFVQGRGRRIIGWTEIMLGINYHRDSVFAANP